MRVVDEDRRAAAATARVLQAALGALQICELGKHLRRLAARGDGETGSHQRVRRLEIADQRQMHAMLLALAPDHEPLRKTVTLRADQPDRLARSPDRHQPQAIVVGARRAAPRRPADAGAVCVVHVDDGRRARAAAIR